MIDKASREVAKAIATGNPVKEGTDSKTALYGLLGRTLDIAQLEDGVGLKGFRGTFSDLQRSLGSGLKDIGIAGFSSADQDTRDAIENHFYERDPRAKATLGAAPLQFPFYGVSRIVLGSLNAANREVVTLRTIAQKQAEGETTTLDGLYASSRVPFQLATVHLYDLNDERDRRVVWLGIGEEGGDGGEILRPSDVVLDPEHGLRLTRVPEIDDIVAKDEHGPQIGCPVSLIKGYIQKIHVLATHAALEADLLKAS